MKKINGKIVKKIDNIATIECEETIPDNFQDYQVIIQKPTKQRSLDANALAWTLIDRIAHTINQKRDEVYDMMLERYGVTSYLVVKSCEAQRVLDMIGHGRVLGEVTINGKKGIQIQIFIGSSNYNREEFTHYLNRYYF